MSLEQLETAILTRGAGLPDLRIDVEDSDGDLADLTAYTGCTTTVYDSSGVAVAGVTPTTTGIATGFQVSFSDAQASLLSAGLYEVVARGMSAGRTRVGKCRLEVLTH
jgi:hypothetical protein